MSFGERFKKGRLNRGLSQRKAAVLLERTQQNLVIIEHGGVESPRGDFVDRAAELFGVTSQWLLYGDVDAKLPDFNLYAVPIISWNDVVAWPSRTTTTLEEIAMKTKGYEHCFALEVMDDMMSTPHGPISFAPHDTILVDPSKEPESGKFVIVTGSRYDNPVFKKYVVDGPQKLLMSLKDGVPPIVMNGDHHILGVVVRKVSSQPC